MGGGEQAEFFWVQELGNGLYDVWRVLLAIGDCWESTKIPSDVRIDGTIKVAANGSIRFQVNPEKTRRDNQGKKQPDYVSEGIAFKQ
jgi:hypothetical protein